MILECNCDVREEDMAPTVNEIKKKYGQAVSNGNQKRLDDLLQSFGMNAGEIRVARGMIDGVLLHSAIVGGEKFNAAAAR